MNYIFVQNIHLNYANSQSTKSVQLNTESKLSYFDPNHGAS